jgi:hypothetical protein
VRFRPASGHFPEDGGGVTAEARFRVGGFRLHAYATRTRVVVELRGLEHDLSVFALRDVYPGIANGRAWLAEGHHAALAADLRLGPGDYVRVQGNCLWASVAPARATGGFVPALAAFAAALPPVPGARPSVDVTPLPPALRPLARYFGGWTEGDDEARSAYQRRAARRGRTPRCTSSAWPKWRPNSTRLRSTVALQRSRYAGLVTRGRRPHRNPHVRARSQPRR